MLPTSSVHMATPEQRAKVWLAYLGTKFSRVRTQEDPLPSVYRPETTTISGARTPNPKTRRPISHRVGHTFLSQVFNSGKPFPIFYEVSSPTYLIE